jgi:hypothetical protein
MNGVTADLEKSGNLPWAHSQLQTAEQKLKRAIRMLLNS